MADTIKYLADYGSRATVVIVGVADSVQQAGSAQLSGTSRSNDLHNHPRHTARTNTNTSAATMIQINAGSFSYMAAGQYAAIGR